jgi:hypothetical protein
MAKLVAFLVVATLLSLILANIWQRRHQARLAAGLRARKGCGGD